MGGYLCIASNGVPPSVSKRYEVQVNCEFLKGQGTNATHKQCLLNSLKEQNTSHSYHSKLYMSSMRNHELLGSLTNTARAHSLCHQNVLVRKLSSYQRSVLNRIGSASAHSKSLVDISMSTCVYMKQQLHSNVFGILFQNILIKHYKSIRMSVVDCHLPLIICIIILSISYTIFSLQDLDYFPVYSSDMCTRLFPK